jgi:hypothetical protein
MKDFTKGVFVFFGVLIMLIAGGALVMGSDFFLYRWFAPRQEAVRRQVYEQSKSYNQGVVQELQNMQFAYVQADAAHKAALASVILHRAADYDAAKLPPDLRTFIDELRSARLEGGVK